MKKTWFVVSYIFMGHCSAYTLGVKPGDDLAAMLLAFPIGRTWRLYMCSSKAEAVKLAAEIRNN